MLDVQLQSIRCVHFRFLEWIEWRRSGGGGLEAVSQVHKMPTFQVLGLDWFEEGCSLESARQTAHLMNNKMAASELL